MRESKQEQFRIGGVYRDIEGDVIRLCLDAAGVGAEFLDDDGEWDLHGGNFDLATGACLQARWCTLVPGELTQNASGEWIALGVEKPASMTPTLDKLEAEKQAEPAFLKDLRDLVAIQGADGNWNHDDYMCGLYNGLELALATVEGREPQYRTLPAPVAASVSTAKPAISGLQREYSSTHLLGSYR